MKIARIDFADSISTGKAMLRSWPRLVSLVAALIPVIVMVTIIAILIDKSMPAINGLPATESMTAIPAVGLGNLLSTDFHDNSQTFVAGKLNSYGILPSLWGSFVSVLICMVIAVPVSMVLAILCTEFSLGIISKVLRTIVGVLSGIPPIIYATMAVVAFYGVMTATLGGPFGHELRTKNVFMSSLTGGLVLSLLVIPFMAPMMTDSIKNVPNHLKEGSLALGATKWETMKRITIPWALPGIISTIILGSLKALGDVLITYSIVGSNPRIPAPPWDITAQSATLPATSAELAGGIDGFCTEPECAVAYFYGLVLLIIAFLFLALLTILHKRFKDRISQ